MNITGDDKLAMDVTIKIFSNFWPVIAVFILANIVSMFFVTKK